MTSPPERLVLKYRERKSALISALRDAMQSQAADWDALRTQSHQLAGIAAMFGEPEVGEQVRVLEQLLELGADRRERDQAVEATIATLLRDGSA